VDGSGVDELCVAGKWMARIDPTAAAPDTRKRRRGGKGGGKGGKAGKGGPKHRHTDTDLAVPEDAPLVILDPELHLQWTDKAEAIEPAAAEQADAPSEAASDDELDDCSLVFSTKAKSTWKPKKPTKRKVKPKAVSDPSLLSFGADY